MAQREPELAYQQLDNIQLSGTALEVECAYWILQCLPAAQKTQLDTPMNLAIKAKLLHLYHCPRIFCQS